MSLGFSEFIRQTAGSTSVDFPTGYLRKYWSLRRETLTVRCLSTEVRRAKPDKFRNEIRAFLYITPIELFDLIADIKLEYNTVLEVIANKLANEETLTIVEQMDRKLEFKVSVQVRAYEKEYFYLKCLALNVSHGTPHNPIKPQFVLRALLHLSMERTIDEVFTAPEYLFALLSFHECKTPVWRKDVKFQYDK